ncbi:hypothetical protein NCC49_002776 [Naganishia albida]|nr:hypothetical protein NCC49_002776 [Naganishia albida]
MSSTAPAPQPTTQAATSGNGASVPPQVVTIGLAFIATAFFVVVLGFFLRMYLARRRIQAQGEPAPTWLDVFFSIVESRHGRGRAATSGFLYFEPGFGFRRPWDASKGPAEALPIPTLYDCDVELGSEFRDKQIPLSQIHPMTVYNKLPDPIHPTAIDPGNQLGISLLIQMPIAPDQRLYDEYDEPILPEISIGVLDLAVAQEVTRDSVGTQPSEQGKPSSKAGQEVQHLEYRI